MTYTQFDFNFDRFSFSIEEEGLTVKRKRLSNSTETFVRFEDVGSKKVKERSRKVLWLAISLFFLLITILVLIGRIRGGKTGDNAEFVWLFVSVAFMVVYMLTKTNVLYLTNEQHSNAIEFINRKAYHESLDRFIAELLKRKEAYLLQKYFVIDPHMSYSEQYNNFVWLFDEKIITREQLNLKVAELEKTPLKAIAGKGNEVLGFKPRSSGDGNEQE